MTEHGRGTVRTIRSRHTGEVVGYRALLPREYSTPPPGCKNSDRYQEALGPLYDTPEEARRILDAAIIELRDKRSLRHGLALSYFVQREIDARLADAKRRYGTEAQANRVVSTWRSINRLWLKHADFVDWPPSMITTADLQRFVDWLHGEAEGKTGAPLSGSFIRNVVQLLAASMKRAGAIPNPTRDVRLPAKGSARIVHLDLASQIRLLRCEDIDILDRVMIGCGMGAGLRVGELLALEFSDVHVDAADPHLIVRYGGIGRSPTKSGKIRRVELFEPGLGFFTMWLSNVEPAGDLVFGGPLGGYRRRWPDRFAEWTSAAGLRRLSSHVVMRHTYAVAMLSGLWRYEPRTMEFVSQQLGHADISTTQRYYAAFEVGTWAREARRMAGRTQTTERRPVTAMELLGADASIDASGTQHSKDPGHLRAVVFNSPHSPQATQTPEFVQVNSETDAPTHQTLGELAERVVRLAADGDPEAHEAGRDLADAVLASPDVALAIAVLDGGPHSLMRAIELARLIGFEAGERKRGAS